MHDYGCSGERELGFSFLTISLIHVPMMGNEFFPENVFIYSNAPNVSHEIILKEPKYKQSEHQHEIRV